MCLNHLAPFILPTHGPWKNCLPRNQPLVPKFGDHCHSLIGKSSSPFKTLLRQHTHPTPPAPRGIPHPKPASNLLEPSSPLKTVPSMDPWTPSGLTQPESYHDSIPLTLLIAPDSASLSGEPLISNQLLQQIQHLSFKGGFVTIFFLRRVI